MCYEMMSTSSSGSNSQYMTPRPSSTSSSLVSLASPRSSLAAASSSSMDQFSSTTRENDHLSPKPTICYSDGLGDTDERTFLLSKIYDLEVALNDQENRYAQRHVEHLQDNQVIALRINQMEKVLIRHNRELLTVIEQMKEQRESYEEVTFRQKYDATLMVQR